MASSANATDFCNRKYGRSTTSGWTRAHWRDSSTGSGNCRENAVAESFFSSLKKERIKKRSYKTRDLARADIFDYTEMFYDRTRRHSHLVGVSSEAFASASK